MLTWVILVILSGLALTSGIEWLMRRLGVERARPDDAPGGFRDVLQRIEDASRRRDRGDAR